MFIFLNKKKYESLCWSSYSSFSFSCHILVHVKSARFNTKLGVIMLKPWSCLRETGQNAPTFFFQNNNYFTKTPPILFVKMACFYSKMMILCVMSSLVIQDLSSKFIYCLVLTT